MAIELIPDDQIKDDTPHKPETSFAEYLPEDAAEFSGEPAASQAPSPDSAEPFGGDDTGQGASPPPRKRVAMSRKMKKSMDKFMRQIAEMPTLYFTNMATSNPEWALDDEEKDMLTDSVSMVFELLDVGFEIEPLNLTFTSIWWIISYPFVVFGYVFLSKKQKMDAKENNNAT
jgi:hypothetical protein